jgi:prepilin-type N-terminal cleavage/methylation domain-containing protein
MRRGLTLIELIFSMAIIGIVFTVIPKLIMSMNQNAETTIKEEAMFNAMTLMGTIINLPWDENNTVNNQILNVTDGNSAYECNTTSAYGGALGYRIGGFIGGRDCRALNGTYDFNATLRPNFKNDTAYNDIDDYNDNNTSAEINCTATGTPIGLFNIVTAVTYVPDPIPTGNITLSTTTLPDNNRTNTKYVKVQVGYGNGSHNSGCITAFEYHSFNLGNIHIYNSTETGDWQ